MDGPGPASVNPYDKASRYAARALDPVGFLSWVLGVAVVFRGWLETRRLTFPGQPDRTCDTVAHVEDDQGRPWAIPVEFQIKPDPEMFGRFLGYLAPLWLELRPDPERGSRFWVGAVVVNLTGHGRTSLNLEWPAAGLQTSLQAQERNLAGLSAAGTLEAIAAGRTAACVLPWIPLLTGGDDPGIIQRWRELAGAEPDSRRRSDYGALALVFAEAADRRALWRQALEGWNVTESKQVLEWQNQAAVKVSQTHLRDLLQDRFGTVPESLAQRIEATTDPERLRAAVRQVLQIKTPDELQL
jgi:hypothetical protein